MVIKFDKTTKRRGRGFWEFKHKGKTIKRKISRRIDRNNNILWEAKVKGKTVVVRKEK